MKENVKTEQGGFYIVYCPNCGTKMNLKKSPRTIVDGVSQQESWFECQICGYSSKHMLSEEAAYDSATMKFKRIRKPLKRAWLLQMHGMPAYCSTLERWGIISVFEVRNKKKNKMEPRAFLVCVTPGSDEVFRYDIKQRHLRLWLNKPTREELARLDRKKNDGIKEEQPMD